MGEEREVVRAEGERNAMGESLRHRDDLLMVCGRKID